MRLTALMTDDTFSSCGATGKGLILQGGSDSSDIREARLELYTCNKSQSLEERELMFKFSSNLVWTLNIFIYEDLQQPIGFVARRALICWVFTKISLFESLGTKSGDLWPTIPERLCQQEEERGRESISQFSQLWGFRLVGPGAGAAWKETGECQKAANLSVCASSI